MYIIIYNFGGVAYFGVYQLIFYDQFLSQIKSNTVHVRCICIVVCTSHTRRLCNLTINNEGLVSITPCMLNKIIGTAQAQLTIPSVFHKYECRNDRLALEALGSLLFFL